MDQPEVEKGAGPIGVIVVPTRELAEQIHKETRKFSKAYQLRVAAAFGGLSKFEQFKDLKNGSEVAPRLTGHHFWYKVVHALIIMQGMICSCVSMYRLTVPAQVLCVLLGLCTASWGPLTHCDMMLRVLEWCVQIAVCTPGRMIDLIKMKACSMLRATYLVFDEADRMFDMGFEPQVSFTATACSKPEAVFMHALHLYCTASKCTMEGYICPIQLLALQVCIDLCVSTD